MIRYELVRIERFELRDNGERVISIGLRNERNCLEKFVGIQCRMMRFAASGTDMVHCVGIQTGLMFRVLGESCAKKFSFEKT